MSMDMREVHRAHPTITKSAQDPQDSAKVLCDKFSLTKSLAIFLKDPENL